MWLYVCVRYVLWRRDFLFPVNYRQYSYLVMCNGQWFLHRKPTKWQTSPLPLQKFFFDWSICSLLVYFFYVREHFFSLCPSHVRISLTIIASSIPIHWLFIYAKQWNTRETTAIIIIATRHINRSFNKWLLSCSDGFLNCFDLFGVQPSVWVHFKIQNQFCDIFCTFFSIERLQIERWLWNSPHVMINTKISHNWTATKC